MKKFLFIISVILAALAVLPLIVSASSSGGYDVKAFPNEGEGTAVSVSLGAYYGIRLNVKAPFRGVSVRLSTYHKTDTTALVGVYAWKDDFETTVAAEPLVSHTFERVKDNLQHSFTFDELPAGEYFFGAKNEQSELALWQWQSNSVSHGIVYSNGAEAKADINITIKFSEKTDDPFGEVKSQYNITGNNKAPAEYVPAEDSLLITRAADPTTWVATDEMGRTLPTYEDVGGERKDRTVALFYWSWHVSQDHGEPLNLQKFTEQYPESVNDYNFSKWPKSATVNFWNESVFGYYKTNDKWVLRRHAEMLANAGVDVIFFDNTNGTATFRDSYMVIFETFAEAMKDGVDVPKISFLLPFSDKPSTDAQMRSLYQDIFLREKYQELWFYWDGKPMVMAHQNFIDKSDDLGKEISGYFTFRGGQPGYLVSKTEYNTWGWLSTYPQALYYSRSDKKTVEQMTVGVAMNHNSKTHELTAMNGENVMGRTYTSNGYDTRENAIKLGANFEEQFEYALTVDPRVIFITGWNEWIVGRYSQWPDGGHSIVKNAFPDEYNDEFSRDIEPSKGQLRDNYYYQMVYYIRKYKGCAEQPKASEGKTISLEGGADQWYGVGPYYVAYQNNVFDRDAKGYGSTYYTDRTGRNDLIGAKVARDSQKLYFYIECKDDITPYTDSLWMNLYIDSDPSKWGWESFDYVIGKKPASGDTMYLEKFTGDGFSTEDVCGVKYALSGKTLVIEVPKSAIGVSGEDYTVNFKWTDNVQDEDGSGEFKGEILDFYRTGDVAPGGRFKYSFIATSANTLYVDGSGTEPLTEKQSENVPGTDAKDTEAKSDPGNSGGPTVIIIVVAIVAAAAVVLVIILIKKKK